MADDACSVDGCPKRSHCRTWCEMHYARWLKNGDTGEASPRRRPRGPECAVPQCCTNVVAKGFCSRHYQRFMRYGDPVKALRAPRNRDMTEAETAWVAGILEGEGSFFVSERENRVRACVSMCSTDRDVLGRLVAVTGVGGISSPIEHGGSRKTIWQWIVSAAREVETLVIALRPWMCARRGAAIDDMLARRPWHVQTLRADAEVLVQDRAQEGW